MILKYVFFLCLVGIIIILVIIYKSNNKEDWLDEFFDYYVEFGFYKELGETSKEIKKEVTSRYINDWGSNGLHMKDRYTELMLISYDKNVLFLDTECDVGIGNDIYILLLEELSNISNGIFQPTNMTETWEDPEGPIEISYVINSKKYNLSPKYNYDYIDLYFIKELNNSIEGYSFEIYEQFDQSVFIFFLSKEEKNKLIREKSWKFLW